MNLYSNAYRNYASDPYRHVRIETYGQDFGQTSWVTTEESLEIPQLLALSPDSSVWRWVVVPEDTPCTLRKNSVAKSWEWT